MITVTRINNNNTPTPVHTIRRGQKKREIMRLALEKETDAEAKHNLIKRNSRRRKAEAQTLIKHQPQKSRSPSLSLSLSLSLQALACPSLQPICNLATLPGAEFHQSGTFLACVRPVVFVGFLLRKRKIYLRSGVLA
jgi:hypothetical protein